MPNPFEEKPSVPPQEQLEEEQEQTSAQEATPGGGADAQGQDSNLTPEEIEEMERKAEGTMTERQKALSKWREIFAEGLKELGFEGHLHTSITRTVNADKQVNYKTMIEGELVEIGGEQKLEIRLWQENKSPGGREYGGTINGDALPEPYPERLFDTFRNVSENKAFEEEGILKAQEEIREYDIKLSESSANELARQFIESEE